MISSAHHRVGLNLTFCIYMELRRSGDGGHRLERRRDPHNPPGRIELSRRCSAGCYKSVLGETYTLVGMFDPAYTFFRCAFTHSANLRRCCTKLSASALEKIRASYSTRFFSEMMCRRCFCALFTSSRFFSS